MSTKSAVDRERQAALHTRKNNRPMEEHFLEAVERARYALKHGDVKLADRELEYVQEKLEKIVGVVT